MKVIVAVMHLRSKEPTKVYQLGGRVKSSLELNKDVYPSPVPSLEVLDAELVKLNEVMQSRDGSKIKTQGVADQTEFVYKLLKTELIYVNQVSNGDPSLIMLSGFDCSNQPETRDIPGRALIRRIEDSNLPNSAKIYIDPLTDADRYKVEMADNLSTPEWKTILDFGSYNRLEVRDLVRGKEVFLRVTGGNTHGWGAPSEPMAFIPR